MEVISLQNVAIDDSFENLFLFFVIESRNSDNHFVNEDSQRPRVDFEIVLLPLDNFRSHVIHSASNFLLRLIFLSERDGGLFGHSKVNQLAVSIFIEQDVFGFEVSVDDVMGVEVFET